MPMKEKTLIFDLSNSFKLNSSGFRQKYLSHFIPYLQHELNKKITI